jgi:hypothetical protein
MKQEIWKDIPNCKGMYQVSNFGNVKSLSRIKFNKGKFPFLAKERVLKQHLNNNYMKIRILDKIMTVHQLVAMAFLNHKVDGMNLVVDHINNNPLDNRVENLQVITQRHNSSKDIKNKTSKYTGVCWHKALNKWRAYIKINDKQVHLGYFNCELSADLAYQNKLKEL